MLIVHLEYFKVSGTTQYGTSVEPYPDGALVAHLADTSNANLVFSHVCQSGDYEGNFFYDEIAHPFHLYISVDGDMGFQFDVPHLFHVDPSVMSFFTVFSSGTGGVDLSEVLTAIHNNETVFRNSLTSVNNSLEGSINSRMDSLTSNMDSSFQSLPSHFDNLVSQFSSLHEQISNIDLSSLNSSNFLTESSLNGRFGSFPDGQKVTILGLDGIFKVEHSVHMLSNNSTLEQLFFYRCSRVDRPDIIIFAPKQLVVLSSL